MAKIPLEPFNRVMLAVLILFVTHFAGIAIFTGTPDTCMPNAPIV
tara:strand:+ start:1196 stop:1330 length:135 start_codon:yes stop_codon:yes gene_type:complete